MIREIVNAGLACLVTFLICAVGYPAVVYGVGHTLFPKQAEGSLIERDGKVIGSELIAQPFASETYFSPRPSAAGPTGYAADAASGSNLGTTNLALRERIAFAVARQIQLKTEDIDLKAKIDTLDASLTELKTKNEIAEKTEADKTAIATLEASISEGRFAVDARAAELGKTVENLVPVDLVTASGSGLDPHISPAAARYQASRIAKARSIPLDLVMGIIAKHTDSTGMIIGAPARVNVLQLNLALDEDTSNAKGSIAPTTTSELPAKEELKESGAKAPISVVAASKPEAALPSPIDTLSQRLEKLQERVETSPIDRIDTEIKSLKEQVAKHLESEATAKQLKDLGDRVASYGRDVQLIRADLKATREALIPVTTLPALEKEFQALRSEVETLRQASKEVEHVEPKPVVALNLAPAAKLFRERQFPAAFSAFRALAASNPDDARIWYYSALASGLTTGEWRGATEEVALKGVERERAGSPKSQEIDAEFADLTKESGREWLAFYRQAARKP